MKIHKTLIALSIAFFSVLSIFAFQARASEEDRATKLTFNTPVEIPGNKVLLAGTYWFVVPNLGDKDIVQIFDETRTALRATISTVPAIRSKPTDDTELIFAKPDGNQPVALLEWFYPTELTGHEFLYGKNEEKTVTNEQQIT